MQISEPNPVAQTLYPSCALLRLGHLCSQRACPEVLYGLRWQVAGRQELITQCGFGLVREKEQMAKDTQLQPLEGALGLQTARLIPLCTLPPQPQRKRFCEIFPRATPGFAKLCMLFDNYILLIKQFYRLSALGFPYLPLSHPPCHPPTFSLTRRSRDR